MQQGHSTNYLMVNSTTPKSCQTNQTSFANSNISPRTIADQCNENVSSKGKKSKKGFFKSNEIVFETTTDDISKTETKTSTSDLKHPGKCRTLARKFIKSLTRPSFSLKLGKKSVEKKDQHQKNQTNVKSNQYEAVSPNSTEPKHRSVSGNNENSSWQKHSRGAYRSNGFSSTINFHDEEELDRDQFYFIEGYGPVSGGMLMEFKNIQAAISSKCSEYENLKCFQQNGWRNIQDFKNKNFDKTNNLTEVSNLKEELDSFTIKRTKPKPSAPKRSKSVTFIDFVGNKVKEKSQLCPNCHNCYRKKISNEHSSKQSRDNTKPDYWDRTKSLGRHQRSEHSTSSSSSNLYLNQEVVNSFKDVPQSVKLFTGIQSFDDTYLFDKELDNKQLLSSDTNLNNTKKMEIDPRIYENNLAVLGSKVSQSYDGNLDRTESLMYKNPCYHLPTFLSYGDIKNYDVKMYESKLSMDFLVNIANKPKNSRVLKRSQSMRVDLDQTEALLCENHYYGILC